MLSLAVPPLALGGELDLLHSRIHDYYTAAGASRLDARVHESLLGLERTAAELAAPGFLRSDGRWADIDYTEIPTGLWSPWEHFRRTMTMARAWSTPGQRWHHDPTLLRQIEDALVAIDSFYGPAVKAEGNWWFWSLGPALDLAPALLLVDEAIDPAVRASTIATLKLRIGPFPGVSSNWSLLEGQNAVWSAMNHMMVAVAEGDEVRMGRAFEVLASSVEVNAGRDGIQPDLSFHQHGPQLYTGGYGSSFALEVSRWQLLTDGTAWGLSPAGEELFDRFLLESIAFSLLGRWFDPSVIGREVSKPWASGWNGMAALLHGAHTPSPQRAAIAGAAAKLLQSWPGGFTPELAGLAATIDTAPAAPQGLRLYPDSDFAIVRRPGWYASIRMLSTRTRSGESTNGEGLIGSRQADGRMHLALRGDEYWEGEVWPAIDWARLPGITVELSPGAASNYYGKGTRSFVGGAGDGRRGVLAMDLAPADSTLSVKRSWFLFDDAIVSLAAGVRASAGLPVETVVDQRPVSGSAPLVVDGVRAASGSTPAIRWAAGEGIGYVFPRPQSVTISDEVRTGSWSSLGTAASHAVTRTIRTVSIAHGVSPRGESAEYVLLPGADAAAAERFASENPIEVVRNDETAAVVHDRRDGALGIVFWAPSRERGVETDRASVVFMAGDAKQKTLSVAEPSRKSSIVRLTLDGRWNVDSSSARASVISSAAGRTTIEVAVSGGRTTSVTIQAEARRRAVRR